MKISSLGLRIYFKYGPVPPVGVNKYTPEAHRTTTCRIVAEDHNAVISEGIARCSSLDQFNKKKGRLKSLEKALRNLDLNREQRRVIWNAFFHTRDTNQKAPNIRSANMI